MLFDLDGTLVDTGGAGLAAFNEAIRLVFGADGPELDLAGATDGGLLEKVYEHFAYEPTEKSTALFFENYLERLEYNLADPCYGGRLLEGGKTILRELMELGIPMGLLTGNTAAGAEVKVRHYGIDGYFSFGAYGDDHANRNFLGPLALKRAEKTFSRSFEPEEAVI
ncbi:MAG: HAD hydrolase-like protein, partial [Verrucomicrobiota bacterium]